MVFDGMKATTPQKYELENPYRHQNDLPLYNHTHHFSSYPGGHTWEEEHRIHDLPYGYEVGDDPFQIEGQREYPYLMILLVIVSLPHFMHSHFTFNRKKISEVFYH